MELQRLLFLEWVFSELRKGNIIILLILDVAKAYREFLFSFSIVWKKNPPR